MNKAIILSIGNELISGQTVDTNSAYLSRELGRCGIETVRHETVGDDARAVARAILRATSQVRLVFVTGGLGPTADDVTRDGLAEAMGAKLELDERCLQDIEGFFQHRGREMISVNRVQAMIPRGAQPIENAHGTAPGIAATLGSARIFIMPGVPYEMRAMFERRIAPRLPAGKGVILYHVVHTFGMGESDVGEKIEELMRTAGDVTVGTTVAAGLVSVRIISRAKSAETAERKIAKTVGEIRSRLGGIVVGEGDETMAGAVGRLLKKSGQTLATAESCTGGMIGQMITAVAGASEYYLGGVITYANAAKASLLGVSTDDLQAHGAVSEQVAAAMAQGCRERFGTDWSIGVTGIAGPGGASEEKPAGLVYISLRGPGGKIFVRRHIFPGSREIVRRRASLTALNYLRLAML